MELLGSATSPFVRRIRLLLGVHEYAFRDLDIYGADRDVIKRENPTLKIPTLIDDELTLFDSRVIARYLSTQMALEPLSWAQENQLTAIDGANDSAVALLLSMRSGLVVEQDALFYNLQRERIVDCVTWLDAQAESGAFNDWDYPAMCAYCMVDWVEMRGLFDFDSYPGLLALRERHQHQPMVAETDPRLAT